MSAVLAVESLSDVIGWRLVFSLPIILLVAWLAGRLLGVRRSAIATVISGLVGWLSGVGLSLLIARGQENHKAGFTRNVWLFSIVFTMSAGVWMELLARPGAFSGARAGLSIPRPLRSLRRRIARARRYAQITRIAAANGLGSWLGGRAPENETAVSPTAVRLRLTLEQCGGMFVKLGQVLSTRADLLPPAVVTELSRLQDQVTEADPNAVRALIEEELGAPVDTVFASFDWKPVAAASIGQAHRGRLRSGEEVIVKVQRPGIAELVERDIDVLETLANTIVARAPWTARYNVLELTAEFTGRLREELDYRVEAEHASEIATNIAAFTEVHIPHVYRELTTAKLLVMEWLDGVPLRSTDRIDAIGVDRGKLADVLLRCCLQQMLVDGHFHADPHPGNIMVLDDGRIGLIDFGAAGRLGPTDIGALRDMMIAVSERSPAALREAIVSVATLRPGYDDDQLERALGRFMGRHLGAGRAPSAAMFTEMLQIFFGYGIGLPPEFSTLFRALGTLEGTLTTLSPGFLAIDAAQQVAGEWARDRLRPETLEELARSEVMALLPTLRRIPKHVDRIATGLQRGTLGAQISLFSQNRDVVFVTRLWNRAVLAFLGAMVGLMSVGLLAIKGGPPLAGTTSLYQFFGYFGLFCATTLILRVLVAVVRDGTN